MDVSFIHIHFMFDNKIMYKFEEYLLWVRLHGSTVAEVTVQEAYLFGVGTISNKQISQLTTWITQEKRRLISLLLGQRLIQQIENIFTGVIGARIKMFTIV